MKRKIALLLVLLLVLSSSAVYAETDSKVDTTTSASTWEEEEVPATPEAPTESTEAPAPATTETTVKATPTPAPVKTTNTEVSNGQVYIVVDGDKLWQIAEKFNLTLDELVALNPQLKNPNLIYVGQKINVSSATSSDTTAAETVYQGLGHAVNFRFGPGSDSEGVPVYSFNVAMASAMFDAEGRILNVYIDAYEVATPNYDGASMPHFSGWPDKEGYNVTDHETEKVVGVSENTKESIAAEVSAWATKRERGDTYHMNPSNEWYKQMDFYQTFFVGKTVEELETWFANNTTSAGRPIKASTTNEEDLAKLAELTDAEKADLADVVSSATMSVSDAHGDFLGAVKNAYKNRVEVTIPAK